MERSILQFRVLGPLEMISNGEPVDLGAKKQRVLLALLLINANRVVSTDRILESLWGDEAEGGVRSPRCTGKPRDGQAQRAPSFH